MQQRSDRHLDHMTLTTTLPLTCFSRFLSHEQRQNFQSIFKKCASCPPETSPKCKANPTVTQQFYHTCRTANVNFTNKAWGHLSSREYMNVYSKNSRVY